MHTSERRYYLEGGWKSELSTGPSNQAAKTPIKPFDLAECQATDVLAKLDAYMKNVGLKMPQLTNRNTTFDRSPEGHCVAQHENMSFAYTVSRLGESVEVMVINTAIDKDR
jgi:hypothetical protein